MNKEIFEKVLSYLELSKENINEILNALQRIYNEYGEDFKIPALSDNTEIYVVKDKADFFSLEAFLLNRIIRNVGNKNVLKKDDPNLVNNFLNIIHIKNYVDYLKRENIIKSSEEFKAYFSHVLEIRNILYEMKYKSLVSKKNITDCLKSLEAEFLESDKKYKKRAGEEDIEISSDTTIDEVILKSKKKNNAKEIRNAIERDKELLRFEKETREKQKKFPEGTNQKQIEKVNLKNTYKERYFRDTKNLINNKYNIYLFANLNALNKTPEKYINLFKEKIGKENIFKNIFLESIKAYEVFEELFKGKVDKLEIPNTENDSAYLTINKILNEIEYGNDVTYKISMGRLNLIFLEDLSEELTEKYIKEELNKKEEKKLKETKEKEEKVKNAENKQSTLNINKPKGNDVEEFVEVLMADYLLTENKYQVSRRNEDEDYFIDLIFNIINDISKVKSELKPVNGLYDKKSIRQIIRMLVTAKLISFENIEEKNYLKKLLQIEEMKKIIGEIRKNPYISALHRVAEHAKFARGTQEITRLEHDRKRLDDNLSNIPNLNELIVSYQQIIDNIKNTDKTSVTLNANKEQILSNVQNIPNGKEENVFKALISLIKIIARQNNLYPTEEEQIQDGYKVIIDKKYITYIREDLIAEIESILSNMKSQSRKFENY